jgi:hypothetical protein
MTLNEIADLITSPEVEHLAIGIVLADRRCCDYPEQVLRRKLPGFDGRMRKGAPLGQSTGWSLTPFDSTMRDRRPKSPERNRWRQ